MRITSFIASGTRIYSLKFNSIIINFDNHSLHSRAGVIDLYRRGVYVAQIGSADVSAFLEQYDICIEGLAA